jgi:diacylglycerol kinase (ATP)
MDSRPTRTGGGWFRRRARSFACAAHGLWLLLASEPNFRIHAVCAVIVFVGGAWLRIDRLEWCAVLFAIGLVWTAEALNSAIESVCNRVEPNEDPLIRRAKDIAASGVLAASIAAAAIGCMVFLPKLCAAFCCR